MSKPLILVDGSSYLFRAFHALPPLTNAVGEPTNAILGVMNMLRRLLKDYEPTHAVVVFDTKGKTFRHELFPEYKANRDKMPEDLATQIAPLKEMIQLMGLPLIAIEGVEADDVIGTLTQKALKQKQSVLISTGDKDMAQLIQTDVKIVDTMKNVTIDEAYIVNKFGVTPSQIIDFLALVGDTSDNVPGIPKVGPKTAAKWLQVYGDIEQLKQNAGDIVGKVGEYLRENLKQLDLSRKLVTIQCNVDIDIPLSDMQCRPMDIDKLMPRLSHYEFKSWLKEFTKSEKNIPSAFQSLGRRTSVESTGMDSLVPEDEMTRVQQRQAKKGEGYECILTREAWHNWIKKIKQAKTIAIDTETTSLDAMQAKLVGVSFATTAGEAAYLPLKHDYLDAPKQLDDQTTWAELKALLEDESIQKVGQHIKYDFKVFKKHGIELKGIVFDTMLASYVLEAGQTRHNLDTLAKRHLNHEMISYDSVTGKGAKRICFSDVDLEIAASYAAEDADLTFQLYEYFKTEFDAAPALKTLFYDEEMPTMFVLAAMEYYGVLIDTPRLHQQSHDIEKQLVHFEKQAFNIVGNAFNLGSPKQLQEILFDQMGLPILKKTPKGQPSTDEGVLQELAQRYELPKVIVDYRHLAKLKSTYTDKLPLMVNTDTQRVHTSYHQAVAITGRLSSSDPNLQNIPIRSEAGRKIRQAFIAPKGYKIVAADYSQVELRIMAHLSQDAGLIKAFNAGEDIHRATAAEVFGKTKSEVTDEQRRRAKAINFGLIYGMSPFGLAKQLGIPRDEASLYVKIYFDRYPAVKTYMENTRIQAAKQGYVETLFGRRLALPDIQSRNGMRRQAAERAAINAPMQGTAADIIKRAMIAIHAWLDQDKVDAHMIMQVHDELVFEVKESEIEAANAQIKTLMENTTQLKIPLLVDIGAGDNWDEAH